MQACHGASIVLLLGLAASAAGADGSDEDALKAARLPTDGPGLVAFFRARAAGAAAEDRIRALVKQLGHDDFARREEASRLLVAIGGRARAALRQAANDSDMEVARRAQECLQKIEQGAAGAVLAAAARTLGRLKPDGAAAALLAYLPAAEDESVDGAAREALADLAVRDGRPEPALVAALTDPDPVKRSAAAVALCRADAPGQRPAVKKLLDDPDAGVRLRVALALAAARDKDAVPALIGVLPRLAPRDCGRVEELLHRLAGDQAPTPAADPARRAEAWQAWWRQHGAALEPDKLAAATRGLGHTLVVLLDQGKVVLLDGSNNPLWELDELQFPLDAQLLPDDRVLVAEHQGGRVTERNRKNEVVWEHKADGPLVAQRLANGNTFIATRESLVEVDRTGKQVWTYSRPNGEQFMKAQRLPNGDVGCVCQVPGVTRFVRLDRTGKELANFPVDVRSSGGRIDVLPNGHVVVPEMGNNKVVEYSAEGKPVWEATVDQPIAAVRLPSGHTLVTTMTQNRALELDRAGKEVWQFKTDTRVTRAFRR